MLTANESVVGSGASGEKAQGLEAPGAAIVAVTGALYFADRRMKTPDNYFRGFPGLWNLAAFYLLLLRPPPYAAAAFVAALAAATFAPFPFIHPLRVSRLRSLNLAALALWAALAVIALAHDIAPPDWVTGGLLALGAYVCCAGMFRQLPAGSEGVAHVDGRAIASRSFAIE